MATPEELDEIRSVLSIILFGNKSAEASKFPRLETRSPMSRRSPAMTTDPDFNEAGDSLRSALTTSTSIRVSRDRLLSDLSVDGPVDPSLSLEDLAGHLGAGPSDDFPLKENDVFVDLCAFEDFRVEESDDGVLVELLWCTEYPDGALSIEDGVIRPLTDRAQPFVCAVECIERLSQAIGEEKARDLGLAHTVELVSFSEVVGPK